MRPLYFILYITFQYTVRLFFKSIKLVNPPRERMGRTIYVSNHPASFMDPLVSAVLRQQIVFFMVRADVFNTFSRPFFWMVHMLPIYRQQDGGDTRLRNKDTFRKSSEILKSGRNILIFGEGFTDDVFVRRLKPVKKGAVRMGFGALEAINWEQKIYIAAVGNNYTEPNTMRTDLLIATSDKVCLNDFESEYKENPAQVITDVTKKIEELMREQITHVDNLEWTDLHEQIMMITRKGMNAFSYDRNLSLKQRWNYSKSLAKWLNEKDDLNEKERALQSDLESYFKKLNALQLRDEFVYQKSIGRLDRSSEILKLIILFPFMILGILHLGLFYFGIKRYVEKSFKRRVFWGSTKMVIGMFAMGLFNLPMIWIFKAYIVDSWSLGILYYFCIGLFGLAAYEWFDSLKQFNAKGKILHTAPQQLIETRKELKKRIEALVVFE
jgi:hypothetical protein